MNYEKVTFMLFIKSLFVLTFFGRYAIITKIKYEGAVVYVFVY